MSSVPLFILIDMAAIKDKAASALGQKFCNYREDSLYSTIREKEPASPHRDITFAFSVP
jgi:hypothetical protein